MIRFLLILFISTNCIVSTNAQKVHRAAKALNELKFDKSISLFEEVLKKDSNNIVASIGFAKAHLQECDFTKKKVSLEILETCYNLLINASSNIQYSSDEYKELLKKDLNINTAFTNPLKEWLDTNTNLIWKDYMQYETSIAKFENFQTNFYSQNSILPFSKVFLKLDKIYFDSIEKRNTLAAYKFYLNKFDVTSQMNRGKFIDNAKAKIIELEYKEAINTQGIDKLKEFVLNNTNITYEGIALSTSNYYLPLANQELNKREFNIALSEPGIKLLNEFIKKSPRPEQYQIAKDTIENREYNNAKNYNLLNDYVQFRLKYRNSKYLFEVEDSIATLKFRDIVNSNEKKNFINFLDFVGGFHKNNLTLNLIDSAKLLIYNIDFYEANNTIDLNKLLNIYRKYKNTNYINVDMIKNKLFTTWQENILKNATNPISNGLINFIKEFKDEPVGAFTSVIEATKSGLLKYIESQKTTLVKEVLISPTKDHSNYIYLNKLSNIQLNNLSELIGKKLFFTNLVINTSILDNIKSLGAGDNPTTMDLFNIFYLNFNVTNSYIQAITEYPDPVFLLGYQTKSGFEKKIISWDKTNLKYKESETNNINNEPLKSILAQKGFSDFTSYFNAQQQISNYVIIGGERIPKLLLDKQISEDFIN
jgi:hypothetical protein